MTLRKKAFTLIEMLVVIAIIAILAAALFPAIQGAIDSAKATGMKNKGRGIWVAIVSANSEREPLSLKSLWPGVLTTTNCTTVNAEAYFNYLMSNGSLDVSNAPVFVANAQNRVCGDLSPSTLSGAGIQSATGVDGTAVKAENMAWHAALVADGSASEDVFLLTKNVAITGAGQPMDSSASPSAKFDANATAPFGATHAVWVTRGGGTFDARPKYLTLDRVNGPDTNCFMKCSLATP